MLQCVRFVAGGIEASARQLREMYAIIVGNQVMCKKTVHADLRLHRDRGLFAIVVASQVTRLMYAPNQYQLMDRVLEDQVRG